MTINKRIAIVTPVFNDWASLTALVAALESVLADQPYDVELIAVDDCSTDAVPADIATRGILKSIDVIRLETNVGHQRAITVGLVTAAGREGLDAVAIMDSDGEDRPEELLRMLDVTAQQAGRIIVAQRRHRSEKLAFRLFYKLYVAVFRLLTGHRINFGNFSIMPIGHVRRLIHDTGLWNNIAASLVRSRLPLFYLPTRRGTRYFGRSKMNFVGLVTHGLGAISIFSDIVFVRILVASLALFTIASGVAIGVFAIRLFSTYAVPGWTTNVLGFTFLASLQAVMMPVMVAFLLLNNRSTIQPHPRSQAAQFIASITRIDRAAAQ